LRCGLPWPEEEQQHKAPDIEQQTLLQFRTSKAKDETKQGERFTESVRGDVARLPLIQADGVLGLRRQGRRGS